jgi:lysophospholipase L1-like esterase
MMNYRYIIFFGLLGIFIGCEPELEDFNASKGNADFTTYVALGNSLTAGYADDALYHSTQANSYPAILAQQFAKVGGGTFVQPVVESEYGILPGKLKLGYKTDCLGDTSLSPVPDEGTLDDLAPLGYTVNNMGIPGAKSFHLLADGYGDFAGIAAGTANPYYARFASSAISTVVGDAIALQPTFYSLWIGNNDVLGYATTGGVRDSITGQATFAYAMNTIVMSMDATGAKGVIANIPDVTTIPFFNTVPPNSYVLTQGQADTLNMFLGPLGFSYEEGANYFIVEDANSQLGFRQMVEGELLLLTVPQDSLKCAYWGGFNPYLQLPVPIPTQYVLTLDEIANIEAATADFNQIIENLATTYDLAFVDVNDEFNRLMEGITMDGITINSSFITGNAFSLDGVHGTQMGYSHIANMFINAINAKYNSNLPKVSLAGYPANVLP